MAGQQARTDSHPGILRPGEWPGEWPGERQPTQWDVHDANKMPSVTFLDGFRAALLHSEGAEEDSTQPDSELMMDASQMMEPVSLEDLVPPSKTLFY